MLDIIVLVADIHNSLKEDWELDPAVVERPDLREKEFSLANERTGDAAIVIHQAANNQTFRVYDRYYVYINKKTNEECDWSGMEIDWRYKVNLSDTYGIRLKIEGHSGEITSDLKEDCISGVDDKYMAAIDGVESLILACACQGIKVDTEDFKIAIDTAVQACVGKF